MSTYPDPTEMFSLFLVQFSLQRKEKNCKPEIHPQPHQTARELRSLQHDRGARRGYRSHFPFLPNLWGYLYVHARTAAGRWLEKWFKIIKNVLLPDTKPLFVCRKRRRQQKWATGVPPPDVAPLIITSAGRKVLLFFFFSMESQKRCWLYLQPFEYKK